MQTCSSKMETLTTDEEIFCQRKEDHYGRHQAFVKTGVAAGGPQLYCEVDWGQTSSSYNPAAREFPLYSCSDCGFKIYDENVELCRTCSFWAEVKTNFHRYFVFDGRVYSLSAPYGFASDRSDKKAYEVKILTDEGVVIRSGQINNIGDVPSHKREDFPNNAVIKPVLRNDGGCWIPFGPWIEPEDAAEAIEDYENWS